MKTLSLRPRSPGLPGCIALALALVIGPIEGAPLGTTFTYQGRLTDGGSPATGNYDLKFSLYDATVLGGLVGTPTTITLAPVSVTNGLFTVTLDFGSAAFAGNARWLEIGVRSNGVVTPHSALSPRQPLTPAPYALFAPTAATATSVPWSALTGIPAGFLDGIDNDTTYSAGGGLALSGTMFSVNFGGNGAAATAARSDHLHSATDITSGVLQDARIPTTVARLNADETFTGHVTFNPPSLSPFFVLSSIKVDNLNADYFDGLDSSAFWKLGGNSGINPALDFLGTTDNKAFELRVNAARALRLEPNGTSPNVIGGYQDNLVLPGNVGGTISGGGQSGFANSVNGDFGTIGGGLENVAGNLGVVGGGRHNRATFLHSLVAGGAYNSVAGVSGSIAGGSFNTVNDDFGTIGGGMANEAGASATISGGTNNLASGSSSVVGGGSSNTNTGPFSTIGGGEGNVVEGAVATVSGGIVNRASGYGSTVGGGEINEATGTAATVSGGYGNQASGANAATPGGIYNVAAGEHSFAAGSDARASHRGTFVWNDGIFFGFASTADNQYLVHASGGVGVNTTSPTAALDVRDVPGSPLEGAAIHVGSSVANGDPKLIRFGDGDYVHVGENGADDRLELKGSSVYIIAGTVGIGTPTPTHKLEVNGDVAGVGPYNNISDARFKTNVAQVTDALEKVLRLRGVTHDWRRAEYPDKNFKEGRQLGFIAQEVNEVLPEVVSQDRAGFYSIAYSQIIPVLVEAIKVQHRIIDRLAVENEAETAALLKQVVAVKRQLADQQQANARWEARFSTLEKIVAALHAQSGAPTLRVSQDKAEAR